MAKRRGGRPFLFGMAVGAGLGIFLWEKLGKMDPRPPISQKPGQTKSNEYRKSVDAKEKFISLTDKMKKSIEDENERERLLESVQQNSEKLKKDVKKSLEETTAKAKEKMGQLSENIKKSFGSKGSKED